MKQSTLDMIENAMEFNVAVQEDNLHLQERKNRLLALNRELGDLQVRSSFEAIDPNLLSQKNAIGLEVLDMLECSIVDLDKQVSYPHFMTVEDKSAIMYNYSTIWNMMTCFREMLGSLAQLGNQNISYEELKEQFLASNEMNLMLTNTQISDSDYISMNVPHPKVQSTISADMNKEHLNDAGKFLNSMIDSDILSQLANTKYEITAKLESNREDAIKSAHFIAQMIMAIKNSILLMKNYHAATLNELQ